MDEKALLDEMWYWWLTGEWRVPPPPDIMHLLMMKQKYYSLLPKDPDCIKCGIPMAGIGDSLERRVLDLKGISHPVAVTALHAAMAA